MWRPDALDGKVGLVTGAGRGIGLATARALIEAGAEVWLNARSEGSLDQVCAELGPKAKALYFDVNDAVAIRTGFARIQSENKRLDILVNNAGILREGVIEMASVQMIDEVLSTNVRGLLLCSQYAARLMARGGGGSIINLASIMGRFGNSGQTVYAASKAAVIGATYSLAKELAGRQIRVNAIAPGAIDTDMIAALPAAKREALVGTIGMGRLGTAEDIAPVCVFLASDASRYVTGQVIGVDGGMVV
ncbi:SDR family oxidoreductase [Novosphingobium sp. G106]|uniref:SDR family NAD(P)-dependent oxidoreductase n=1 Tax=Novosphingobium sp. G106 TaxID=2849500 RepID=UPI001C2D805C|nr:SDR family NAD(P)-dependent oxidoreductase [Novosphingobium sp. G106]MBV1689579.1 SDR family oxidoreductase [Novosphingobium sp. G106]